MATVRILARKSDPVPFLAVHRHPAFAETGELALLIRARSKRLATALRLCARPFCYSGGLVSLRREVNGTWTFTACLTVPREHLTKRFRPAPQPAV